MDSVALVTGANRGLGLETTRQLADLGWTVYLGARSLDAGTAAAETLGPSSGDVRPVQLDVADRSSIERAAAAIDADTGHLTALVNNAAIHYDTWQRASEPDFDVIEEAMEVNVYGAWHMTIAALPMLRRSGGGRIVNVSSGAGALSDMGGGLPAYHLTKVGLNALTRMFAAELASDRVLVNSVCPGWVATDMGGSGGRPVEDGASGIVWAATLPDGGPSGGFFRDGKPIDW